MRLTEKSPQKSTTYERTQIPVRIKKADLWSSSIQGLHIPNQTVEHQWKQGSRYVQWTVDRWWNEKGVKSENQLQQQMKCDKVIILLSIITTEFI